jgi:hypothetical protein
MDRENSLDVVLDDIEAITHQNPPLASPAIQAKAA